MQSLRGAEYLISGSAGVEYWVSGSTEAKYWVSRSARAEFLVSGSTGAEYKVSLTVVSLFPYSGECQKKRLPSVPLYAGVRVGTQGSFGQKT